MRLSEPTGGTVTFEGQELSSLSGSAMREKRRKMQMIFQDPYASLNPRMRVGEIVGEGLTHPRPCQGQRSQASGAGAADAGRTA